MADKDNNNDKKNDKEVNALLEMLKQSGVNPQQVTTMNLGDDDKKKGHAFWGTQVSYSFCR
jgi:hypothetical protein